MKKIFDYYQFINESKYVKVPFVFSIDFGKTIRKIDELIGTDVANKLLDRTIDFRSDISLIDLSDDPNMVEFTTADKISQKFNTTDFVLLGLNISPLVYSGSKIYNEQRSKMKIGKFLKKILGDDINDQEVEKFSKAYESQNREDSKYFEIYRGVDIKIGYDTENFVEAGSSELHNSCMNDRIYELEFFLGCPVMLLTLKQNEKICARALIWEVEVIDRLGTLSGKSKKYNFMDRVYYIDTKDLYRFQRWSKENKVLYKSDNKTGPFEKITMPDGTQTFLNMKCEIKIDLDEWLDIDNPYMVPYIDTLCHGQKNQLSNFIPSDGKYYVFQETDGTVLVQSNMKDVNGERIPESESHNYVMSNYQQGLVHVDDVEYVEYKADGKIMKDPIDIEVLKQSDDFKQIDNKWIKVK